MFSAKPSVSMGSVLLYPVSVFLTPPHHEAAHVKADELKGKMWRNAMDLNNTITDMEGK